MRVRAKALTPIRDAWQYQGTLVNAPEWVLRCIGHHGGPLLLVRCSGAQVLHETEWLIKNISPDARDPNWLTDVEFRAAFEFVQWP